MQDVDLLEYLRAHPDIKTGRAIAFVFTAGDILGFEDENGYQAHPINEREATEILKRVERNHDANYGVTWDSIEDEIRAYIREHPRTITRADVAVGRAWGGHDSGGWDLMKPEIPTHRLEILNDLQIKHVFEAAAQQLDARGEECVFLRTLAWEVIEPDEDDEESEEQHAADRT